MRARHRHFNPRGLGAGLVLDARYIDQADNTAVSTWSDRSGNGWDATQTDSNFRPTLQTAEFGGQNVVRFDGINDRLSVAGAVGLLNNTAGSTLSVTIKFTNTSGGNRSALAFSTGVGTTRSSVDMTASGYSAGGRRLDANSFQSVTSAGGQSATRTLIQTAVFDYANAALTLFLDGTSSASSASFQTAGNTSNTNSTSVNVGCSAVGTQFGEADIAEVVAFNSALNASQRKRMEHAISFAFKIPCN
jgi:hypothetical protein